MKLEAQRKKKNVQPNGLSMYEGQIFITTEEDGGGQEENAAATFVSLARTNAEGTTGSATGVMFFSTNSTGQLAFLNNMVGISQLEFSPEEATIKIWEWKGGSLAPKNGSGRAATTGNQSTAPES